MVRIAAVVQVKKQNPNYKNMTGLKLCKWKLTTGLPASHRNAVCPRRPYWKLAIEYKIQSSVEGTLCTTIFHKTEEAELFQACECFLKWKFLQDPNVPNDVIVAISKAEWALGTSSVGSIPRSTVCLEVHTTNLCPQFLPCEEAKGSTLLQRFPKDSVYVAFRTMSGPQKTAFIARREGASFVSVFARRQECMQRVRAKVQLSNPNPRN